MPRAVLPRFLLCGLACTAAALALAACGGSGASSRARTPRLTINAEAQYTVRALVIQYQAALNAGDVRTACADLTPELQAQIVLETQRAAPSVGSCEQALTLALRAGRQQITAVLGHSVVRSIIVSGDRATIVTERDGQKRASRAVHEPSGWKLEESP